MAGGGTLVYSSGSIMTGCFQAVACQCYPGQYQGDAAEHDPGHPFAAASLYS
jgi:hypothetical protein